MANDKEGATAEEPEMVPVGKFIVGMLVATDIIKPEDAERAAAIVEEELKVWLSIRHYNKPH